METVLLLLVMILLLVAMVAVPIAAYQVGLWLADRIKR
jgi:hypothetical protein